MTKRKFRDRIGPGTPAWNAFDNALDAYILYDATGDAYARKRYENQRQYMIRCLRAADFESLAPQWSDFLKIRIFELTGHRVRGYWYIRDIHPRDPKTPGERL